MAVSDSEMNRMQQDAIRRVREMQARAMQYQSSGQPESRRSDTHAQQRQTAPSARNAPAERRETPGAQGQHAPQNTAAHADRSQHTQQSAHASPGASSSGREAAASNQRQAQPPKAQPAVSAPPAAVRPANPVTDIFQMLFRDSDRTLLLALILILSEEKSDPGLLFALLYIAL